MNTSFSVRFSKEEYADYLRSSAWQELRARVYSRDPICRVCERNKSENIHHLRYRNIDDVTLDDLIGICRDCHNKVHSVIPMAEDLSLKQIRTRLKNPKILLTDSILERIRQSSTEIQRRIRGVLKGDPYEGRKVTYTAYRKILDLLNRP